MEQRYLVSLDAKYSIQDEIVSIYLREIYYRETNMSLSKNFKRRIKLTILIGLIFIFISLIVIIGIDQYVTRSVKSKVFYSLENIPFNNVGLLLGTAKMLSNRHSNLYYKYRIEAAVKLFKAGKIRFILVSGDNSTRRYNEPTTIKKDLEFKGISADKIYLDYAGFRTLDSVVRSKQIFGQNSITIISQQFHNERAIFIAERKGINAIGFNAEDVNTYYGFKTKLREKFARVKMVIDLVFNKQPKFLGNKIEIK